MPTTYNDPAQVNPPSGNFVIDTGPLHSKWGWFVALGVVLILLGFYASYNIFIATIASVFTVGVLMLISGILQIIHAFYVKSWSNFIWLVLTGLVYAAAGIMAFMNPVLASTILTFLLAAALVGVGVLRIVAGLNARPAKGWGWILFSGIITLLAGIVIAIGWPVNSLWILGMFLAVDLIIQGWAMAAFGFALKR